MNLLVKMCVKWISKSAWVSCLTEDPDGTSTSKCNHPSHVHILDRYLHSDRAAVIYIAQQRDRIKRQRHQKAAKHFFFLIISFLPFQPLHSPSPTPNHHPSGLACHCWVSHSNFRGAPDSPLRHLPSLFLFLSLLLGNLPFHQSWSRSHQSANFIVQMGSGAGQLPGFSREERPWPGYALRSAHPHPTPGPSSSSASPPLCPLRTRDALRVNRLFARTLGPPQGVRYPLQEPLSSGQWLMKPTWWQVLMSCPRLV